MAIQKRTIQTMGISAALAFGMAATAAAQATTTSTTSIPVVKSESKGEVVSKTDTVTMTVYKTDTTRIYSTDTLRMTVPGPVTTVTRVDTVTLQPIAQAPHMGGGLYWGAAGGGSLPYGSIRSVNNPAYAMQVQLGWQGLKQVFGLRADVNYAGFSDAATYAGLGPHPQVYNENLDAKLQVPYLTHLFGYAPRFTVYAIGGGSMTEYRNLRLAMDANQSGFGPDNAGGVNTGWQNNMGWNAGGGVSFHWRNTELFAESRVISFDPESASKAYQIPIMLGLNWY